MQIGLVNRIVSRAGFDVHHLNTENFRLPYLTILPGLTPTFLLNSPGFLLSFQVKKIKFMVYVLELFMQCMIILIYFDAC